MSVNAVTIPPLAQHIAAIIRHSIPLTLA